MAWSRPRPASTQTTIRSRASGRAGRSPACGSADEADDEVGQVEEEAGDADGQISELLVHACDSRGSCRRRGTGRPPGRRTSGPGRCCRPPSPRKPALASLVFSLPSSASVFGCSGLARAGVAFSSILVIGVGLFQRAVGCALRRLRGILQFVEPFDGPGFAGGHDVQHPPCQRGERAEQRQRHQAFEIESSLAAE